MSLAPQELENSASKYAAEAIRLDSQGSRGMAIQSYQRAIEALVKLGRKAEARALAERFVKSYGPGPLAERVSRLGGLADP